MLYKNNLISPTGLLEAGNLKTIFLILVSLVILLKGQGSSSQTIPKREAIYAFRQNLNLGNQSTIYILTIEKQIKI